MRTKREMRAKRKSRIRATIFGTRERPRFVVFRSNAALEVQVIDDTKRVTLVSAHTKGKSIAVAKELGVKIVEAMKAKKIGSIVFDRGGYRYHGSIKALADAVREGGIQF